MTDEPKSDHVFDGGAMDCGSGLILLIRQNMLEVPVGGILEIRSSEPTVESELPPWCRMVGHTHVGTVKEQEGAWRHWVQRFCQQIRGPNHRPPNRLGFRPWHLAFAVTVLLS